MKIEVTLEQANTIINVLVYSWPFVILAAGAIGHFWKKSRWWDYGHKRGFAEGRAQGMTEALHSVRMSGHSGGPVSGAPIIGARDE